MRGHIANDITGERFGSLVVIRRVDSGKKGVAKWECKCDCGNVTSVITSSLRNGKTKSCGCKSSRYMLGEKSRTHGASKTRLYNIWCSMKQRCDDKNAKPYKYYGGRGITVCDEWEHSFESFREWAFENGYDPNADRGKITIDRIDCNKGYAPDNCRFVPMSEQCRNKRNVAWVDYNGEHDTIVNLAKKYGVAYNTALRRWQRGCTAEEIFSHDIIRNTRSTDHKKEQ